MRHFKTMRLWITALIVAAALLFMAPQTWAYNVRTIDSRLSTLITAGETLTTGQVVCIKDADGYAYKADANDSVLMPACGVVGKGAASGSYVEIITRGKLSGWTGLSEGQPGYVSDTAGAVTQTPSTTLPQQVAVAVSATEYEFDFSAKMDAELAALAGVTSAANAIPYFTGSGTAGVISSSANMIALLGSADYSTARTNLGVAIGSDVQAYSAGTTLNTRHRVTVAEINAGHEILPAIAGKSYRMIECLAIAYGGAVGTTTTVDLLGTQSAGSVKLVAYAQASLTQSAVLVSGASGAAVQADGASYTACDANTAITVGKTGGDADTATGVDIILTYVIE